MPSAVGEMGQQFTTLPELESEESGESTSRRIPEIGAETILGSEKGVDDESEKAFQQLAELSKEDIDRMLISVMKDHSEETDYAEAERIRTQLGLPNSDRNEAKQVEQINEQQEKLRIEIEAIEKQCLDLPEELTEEANEAFRLRVTKMIKTPNMTEREFNLELEESRRELVEMFVKDATESFLKEFKSKYDDAENKDNVIKLIKVKVANIIRKESQGFILYGGDPSFALRGELKFVEYSVTGGEKKKLVTEFNLKRESLTSEEQDEALGIGSNEREEIEKAKESGDLKEDIAA